jgi:acetyl-CoA synthase
MSSVLKQTMPEELKAAAVFAGAPDLLDQIADETICTEVPDLVAFLESKNHPALTMDPLM